MPNQDVLIWIRCHRLLGERKTLWHKDDILHNFKDPRGWDVMHPGWAINWRSACVCARAQAALDVSQSVTGEKKHFISKSWSHFLQPCVLLCVLSSSRGANDWLLSARTTQSSSCMSLAIYHIILHFHGAWAQKQHQVHPVPVCQESSTILDVLSMRDRSTRARIIPPLRSFRSGPVPLNRCEVTGWPGNYTRTGKQTELAGELPSIVLRGEERYR